MVLLQRMITDKDESGDAAVYTCGDADAAFNDCDDDDYGEYS